MANLRTAITSRLPRFLRWTLECGQRFGVNITPNHFYSEIPNFRHLRTKRTGLASRISQH